MPVARLPALGLTLRAFELRANVTAYRACYVALAEALNWRLFTLERRLAHAYGPRCDVLLITLPVWDRWVADPHVLVEDRPA